MKGVSFPVLQHAQDTFPNVDVEVCASLKRITMLQLGMPDQQATGVFMLCRPHEHVWSGYNISMRAIATTGYMAIITLICCLIPFFG